MSYTQNQKLIPRTPGAYLKSYENPVPCKHIYILMKHFKLYPRCWFIHKYCKYFGKDSWKISLVLTYRQIGELLQWVSTVRTEYSARFLTYTERKPSFIFLNSYLTWMTDTAPKTMRQTQKGLTCENHKTTLC